MWEDETMSQCSSIQVHLKELNCKWIHYTHVVVPEHTALDKKKIKYQANIKPQ